LGGEKFELLVGLLKFIRSAHYWTLMHPELVLEDDLKELLRQHEELAGLLSEDREAGHYEMGTRLFEELESLRDPLTISNDIAVPLALIVNELLTNAIQHSRPISDGGTVHVVVSKFPDDFSVSVSDPGSGPDPAQTTFGLGTRLVDALARQINAAITKERSGSSYTVTVTVPHLRSRLGSEAG
jgi:two-component sensor histidine kinase